MFNCLTFAATATTVDCLHVQYIHVQTEGRRPGGCGRDNPDRKICFVILAQWFVMLSSVHQQQINTTWVAQCLQIMSCVHVMAPAQSNCRSWIEVEDSNSSAK